jgi:hypothetical protein
MRGGGAEDISKLMVNFSWPLILSKYFFHCPHPLNIINSGTALTLFEGGGGGGGGVRVIFCRLLFGNFAESLQSISADFSS